ncbi:MAG: glycosyltransferase family 4 protein, partial [Acidobacteria bacterium]|nr:glycosyltransferase family 4 protein [Acidobacteriota bacterium]
ICSPARSASSARCPARRTSSPGFRISTLHPHKNIDRLLRAFAVFRRTRPEFRLVLAGMRGFHGDVVESLRAQLGLQDAVELTGWIERPRLMELYARAAAFVYPSSFEGFGMPVLEAMAAGLPVACSRIPPLEEIGADAVRYFDPEDVDDLVSALFAVTGDESVRRDLACRGPRRAAGFSWTEAARKTLAALEAV